MTDTETGAGPQIAAPPVVTALDESYGHQRVAPRTQTEHESPNWQERCYHLLFAGDDLILNMGRAVWPQAGLRRAFLGACTGTVQHCVRVDAPYAPGDDPDEPVVDGVRVQSVAPLKEVELAYADPDGSLALELTYRSRFVPLPTTPLRIEQDGAVATHYMNFFQSGVYDGWVEVEGNRHEVRGRHGFRDRGWGVRKHEGAPRRGLVLAVMAEFAGRALYMLLFETASGRRVLQDGWLVDGSGTVRQVTGIEHDLTFDGVLLSGGQLGVDLDDGRRLTVGIDPRIRLFLSGVGYSPDPVRQGPGRERHDLTDPAVVAFLRGQTDHGTVFTLDGEPGHGYVETGLGVHARYLPSEDGGPR
ncbi:hypothetical protein FSW04_25265 [Baekduia soli]|uniref:DUF2804 family protein n=1 Tax=Baekduia soli TaxID=496014 RepID=A0A5B8UBI1_9ACTN|nr:hypothetical protein [Baekduia soli]QEC50569.1 hypothetical protein FSW04_25265 [Baekduia soli]